MSIYALVSTPHLCPSPALHTPHLVDSIDSRFPPRLLLYRSPSDAPSSLVCLSRSRAARCQLNITQISWNSVIGARSPPPPPSPSLSLWVCADTSRIRQRILSVSMSLSVCCHVRGLLLLLLRLTLTLLQPRCLCAMENSSRHR